MNKKFGLQKFIFRRSETEYLEVDDILTVGNRIAEKDGMSLSAVQQNMQQQCGKVIHNSFLDNEKKTKMERKLLHQVKTDRFNYMAK